MCYLQIFRDRGTFFNIYAFQAYILKKSNNGLFKNILNKTSKSYFWDQNE